jgi:RNA polymerase sigma-70 factor (ECF subfamily)
LTPSSGTPPPDGADSADELLAAARAGSPDALGRVLELCRNYLLHVANAELDPQLRAKAGASDLVQETFVEAQRIFARFEGGSPAELHAWLRAILRNKMANFTRYYRDAARRRVGQEVHLDEGTSPPEPPAAGPTPSRELMQGEQLTALAAALERLPEQYRQVIVWRQLEDLSFADIAGRLGRTEAAVRKLWLRALEHLHREMGDAL